MDILIIILAIIGLITVCAAALLLLLMVMTPTHRVIKVKPLPREVEIREVLKRLEQIKEELTCELTELEQIKTEEEK